MGRAGPRPGPAARVVPPAPCRSPARVGSVSSPGGIRGPAGHHVPASPSPASPTAHERRSIIRGAAAAALRPLRDGGSSFPGLCSGCLWGLGLPPVLRQLSSLLRQGTVPRARPRPLPRCLAGLAALARLPSWRGEGARGPCLCQGLAPVAEKSAANKILMGTCSIL